MSELTVRHFIVNDDDTNKDVDTYIKEADGSEWVIRTYLDKETDDIETMSFIRFASTESDSFDDAGELPPPEIETAYQEAMPKILDLIENVVMSRVPKPQLAPLSGLVACTDSIPILSQTICFQAGDKSIVLDEKGLHYCGKLVGDADIAGAFKDYLHSSGVLSVGSAERLLCIIPQLIRLCLEQGHAIRHLDEGSQYSELWSNDGGYVPDWRFSTARSLVIANRPELWPLEDRPPQNAADKGEFGGSCNITHCQRPNSATWFNHSTRKYYCRSCAHDLNYDSFNRREALEMWGHLLCTEGKYDPDTDYRKLHDEHAARKDAP